MSERVLAKIAYRAEPEGVLAVVEAPQRELPRGGTLYLVAVGIEKPGNLGAMARTAEAAGADALVVAEAQADPWNPNAIRASTGAVFTLPGRGGDARRGRARSASQLVAAVVDAPTRYTDADLTRAGGDRRRRRGRGPRRALARRRRPHASRSRSRPRRRQPERRHGRGGSALRGGAPAWLTATTSSARARDRRAAPRPRRRCSARARSARASSASSSSAPARSSRAARSTSCARSPTEEKRRGVIAISAGNHAQAAAFAAREYGVDALVVMWQGASEQKIEATRGYGAAVDLEATDPAERVRATRTRSIEETGRTLVHPFDDPVVLAGAGTVGLEIEEDAPDADAVIVAGRRRRARRRHHRRARRAGPMRVIAVEPETSPALHARHRGGRARARRRRLDRRRPQRAVRRPRSRSSSAATSSASS